MWAVPALVCAPKMVPPLLLSMVAFPAVLIPVPPGVPNRVTPPDRLVMLALPALLASTNAVTPTFLLTIVIVLAVLLPKNVVKPPSLVSEVMADVSALTMANRPWLVMLPTSDALWVVSPSCNDPQTQMKVPPVLVL